MGGRGSSTGVSDHGIPYGREYHSLLTVGNIKFYYSSNGNHDQRACLCNNFPQRRVEVYFIL